SLRENASNALRLAVADKVESWFGKSGHRFERCAEPFVVDVIQMRCPILSHLKAPVVHPNAREPLRFAVRQRLQADVTDDAEERRVGADAERERDNRQARESRIQSKLTKRIAQFDEESACCNHAASIQAAASIHVPTRGVLEGQIPGIARDI